MSYNKPVGQYSNGVLSNTKSVVTESKPVERLCWFCKHFTINLGQEFDGNWSSWTPGTPEQAGSMECAKRVWIINTKSSQSQLNAALVRARTCDLFEPSNEAIALFNTSDSKGQ